MGVAYQVLKPRLTVDDIIAIRRNPEKRLTASPLGMTPEELREHGPRVYISEAVDWKGKKGDEFIKVAEDHGALLQALGLARKISVLYKGVRGTTIDPKTGRIVPKKGVAQRNWRKEHPELVRYYNEEIKPRAKKFKPKAYINLGLTSEVELGGTPPAA